MFPTLGIGVAALVQATRSQRVKNRALVALCLATLGSGFLGALTGVIRTFQAAAQHPLEQQIRFVLLGTSESLHNIVLALILLTLTGLVTAARR